MEALKEELKTYLGADYAAAVSRLGGNEAFYLELLFLFFDEALKERLERALAENDLSCARLLAHNIKGTAANLGLGVIAAEAAEAERALKAGQDARRAFTRLQEAYAALESCIKQMP